MRSLLVYVRGHRIRSLDHKPLRAYPAASLIIAIRLEVGTVAYDFILQWASVWRSHSATRHVQMCITPIAQSAILVGVNRRIVSANS